MDIFRWIGSLFRPRTTGDDAVALTFYVRCDHCKEVIRVRADTRWDLVQEFNEELSGYALHKDVLGTQCNRLMRLHVTFDRNYRIVGKDAEGGQLVTEREYMASAESRHQR